MTTMKEFESSSYLDGSSAAYVDALYEDYLKDASSVPEQWQAYFDGLPDVAGHAGKDASHANVRDHFKQMARQPVQAAGGGEAIDGQEAVDQLIDAYRRYGHLAAKIDPLGHARPGDPRLLPRAYGLASYDNEKTFNTRGILGKPQATLGEILQGCQAAYTGSIGIEYDYVSFEDESDWIKTYTESTLVNCSYAKDAKLKMLDRLIAADGMEEYLAKRFVGQKRFSIEGGDALIPGLWEVIDGASAYNVRELVIGMAHRGRLNVLLNVMGKPPAQLIREFEGKGEQGQTTGDVKYHMGYSSDIDTPHGPMHLSLAYNPSHLEFINPVMLGSVRARQRRSQTDNFNHALAVQIHGDAAYAGQGVVMETLAMSLLNAYTVGGSIHIILNNQIGYTTSRPEESRSSRYCSGLSKMIEAPVLHVNGDDVEAVVAAMRMALEYRMRFHKDVVLDVVCYRRNGHNEADEPAATQPMMYKTIRAHDRPYQVYAKQLVAESVCTDVEVDGRFKEFHDKMDRGDELIPLSKNALTKEYEEAWKPYVGQVWDAPYDSTYPLEKLKMLGQEMTALPEGFTVQRQVGRMLESRAKMLRGEAPLDWGSAENLAYATLLAEGGVVRFSGEDVCRGTFAHRHAVLHDVNTGEQYCRLQKMPSNQGRFRIYNSHLSEAAVLGFEYGFSQQRPEYLVIWEAQFGDFANGAQVIIDQFLSSAWQKWNRLSGVMLLLPHGNEGMGPEHSSARLERFMQLAAQNNLQVCVPSTPSQMFHLIRRQVLRPYRRPCVTMTPKSLLRHKLAVSELAEIATGSFQLIIPEIDDIKPKGVKRLVFCTGKVFYDLLEKRRENNQTDVAIIRIEQLYPFPYAVMREAMQQYAHVKSVVWCQEEPKNQGAWFIGKHRLRRCMQDTQALSYVGRSAMAAPATGYPALHVEQQKKLVDEALDTTGI